MMIKQSDGYGGAEVSGGNVTFVFPMGARQFPISQEMLRGMFKSPLAEFSGLALAELVAGGFHVTYKGEVLVFTPKQMEQILSAT